MSISHVMQAPATPEEHKVSDKTYYHQHNYARVHPLVGGVVQVIAFANHRFTTDDIRIQKELDLVADVPGTMIYTRKDAESAQMVVQEAAAVLQDQLQQTAAASDAVNNRAPQPGAVIVPVQVSTGQGVPGMVSSLSGSAAIPQTTLQPVAAPGQPMSTEKVLSPAEQRAAAAQAALNKLNPGTNTQ